MNIHQMQVRYQMAADRVLWQLRTTDGALYEVWLTRRMLRQLWAPLQRLVTQSDIAQVMPHASVLPEAQAMLAPQARARPLPGASFNQPFVTEVSSQPLGTEPLLPEVIDLTPLPQGQGLKLQLREGSGRHLAMQLHADLANAWLRLLDKAVVEADWGLVTPGPASGDLADPRPPVLN